MQHGIDKDRGFVEYRVVNQDGTSPSIAYEASEDAHEAKVRRLARYPEDGPQRLQWPGLTQS